MHKLITYQTHINIWQGTNVEVVGFISKRSYGGDNRPKKNILKISKYFRIIRIFGSYDTPLGRTADFRPRYPTRDCNILGSNHVHFWP